MNAGRLAFVFSHAILIAASCVLPSVAQKTASQASHHTLDMTVLKPETEGFSSERLERLHTALRLTVDSKDLSGVVTILARHGKVVDYWAYGQRDMASGALMTKD